MWQCQEVSWFLSEACSFQNGRDGNGDVQVQMVFQQPSIEINGPWWSCDLIFFSSARLHVEGRMRFKNLVLKVPEGVAGGKEDAEGGGRRWELGVIEGSSKAVDEVGKSPKWSSEVVV
ncbi:hypothetical protein RHMOL_Rhmol11G0181400 [Rhododendron molle]|uniref:Uncharacterized protein n=1 Tax=Rhododendron molle TaxID=49168 RepID=A0ACC0LTJ7_RHOML|nr:hypothetical protein RHMOL_Rhmol11G0181400 [Rhododendron molle]